MNDQRVVLILVDAMRPDSLTQAATPVMDRLMAKGAGTLNARTVMPSSTLPCTTSLFLSAPPEVHGVTTNTWAESANELPGLMDAVKEAGGTAASFTNWEPLRDLSRPGSLAASLFIDACEDPDGAGDRELTDMVLDWFGRHKADFAFIYLGYADIAGHNVGYMSDHYLDAVANADACIGRIVGALTDDTVVMVTADHGGHGTKHGTDCDEDMTIPMLLVGPGIPANSVIDTPASILDIAPTLAALLGLDAPTAWRGKQLTVSQRS